MYPNSDDINGSKLNKSVSNLKINNTNNIMYQIYQYISSFNDKRHMFSRKVTSFRKLSQYQIENMRNEQSK